MAVVVRIIAIRKRSNNLQWDDTNQFLLTWEVNLCMLVNSSLVIWTFISGLLVLQNSDDSCEPSRASRGTNSCTISFKSQKAHQLTFKYHVQG